VDNFSKKGKKNSKEKIDFHPKLFCLAQTNDVINNTSREMIKRDNKTDKQIGRQNNIKASKDLNSKYKLGCNERSETIKGCSF